MTTKKKTLPLTKEQLISDYRLGYKSRQASVIGRREVLTGKAKFGIFGDGKELAQLALAHHFKKGDWRSGYYRDQTWLLALGIMSLEQFFAQLYAHADENIEPLSGGRNMTGHFSSALIDKDGNWLNQMERYNTSADIAPTGAQMPRAVGLAYASVLYRKNAELKQFDQFSNKGSEVVWTTIGNASTSEGMFWEAVNAIGVLHAPAVISVYDDGYGISVPNEFQMVKESIYDITKGFERIPCPAAQCDRGYDLYQVHAWDYAALLDTYDQAAEQARTYHIPALIHVTKATQPQGHSTSGSQERYKSKERLDWEAEFDCLRLYRLWLIENNVATDEQLTVWEKEDKLTVEKARKAAWEAFQAPMRTVRKNTLEKIAALAAVSSKSNEIAPLSESLANQQDLFFKSTAETAYKVLALTRGEPSPERDAVLKAYNTLEMDRKSYYDRFLLSDSAHSPFKVPVIQAKFSADSAMLQGYEVLNKAFDLMLAREPRLVIFGEDVGHLGDVNQGLKGMQEKYGPLRVTDTGIRETTILGQGIGLALRGLRPIAEIQYLDYLLYALQIMADDLSNLRWRTAGQQQAPVIVRTRGHRLEGIFHAGSPMAGIINLVRGMHVLVPRNLTQASGFYNTLIQGDDPAIVVESLNGYRIRERLPDNIGEFTVPIGIPEVITQGKDLTIVSYGSTLRIVHEAVKQLANLGVEAELIDVQSLLPFDINGMIVESLKKTNRILFVDEDVPGGTTAYMLQQVLEKQGGYAYLDSAPVTLSAANHRPAYADDGDYYSKPNVETMIDAAYGIMREAAPSRYPAIR
ncbi:MAG: thiamine pyrophosphate-dependent enzyme [Anaerolineaceae bacterium]